MYCVFHLKLNILIWSAWCPKVLAFWLIFYFFLSLGFSQPKNNQILRNSLVGEWEAEKLYSTSDWNRAFCHCCLLGHTVLSEFCLDFENSDWISSQKDVYENSEIQFCITLLNDPHPPQWLLGQKIWCRSKSKLKSIVLWELFICLGVGMGFRIRVIKL